MDIIGKNVDPAVLEKIAKMLNTPDGVTLKNKLQNLDKDNLVKIFSQLNISSKDVDDISDKIKNLSQAELMSEILKRVNRG